MFQLKPARMRVKRIMCLALFFLVFSGVLFAMGKKDEEQREAINNQFILLITAFDVSALPPGQQILGSILQKELVFDLNRIHHRTRNGEEISRYEELAIIAASHQAAANLASKREQRDALLYSGVPGWKYKKEIRRIDKELRELEAAYKKAEEEIPLIDDKPLFGISEENSQGNFPPPPARGREEAFLKTNNADAFLEGKFRIVYGRVYAEFRFFTRGASFIYEDSTIFSPEDLNAAADELKSRFLAALVNSEPAVLHITAEPDNARLELNGRLVKSGGAVELPPGPVTIKASADDHQTAEKELELEGGDSQEIAFVLKPFTMETLGINLDGKRISVYMGAMYLGGNIPETTEVSPAEETTGEETASEEIVGKEIAEETTSEKTSGEEIAAASETEVPIDAIAEIAVAEEESRQGFFSVYVPIGQYRYIRIETEDGLTGEAIVKGSPADEIRIITLQPRKLPGKDDKPVEDKRKKFYNAYGRFWIALPIAFLTYGFFQVNNNAYAIGMYNSNYMDLYKSAKNLYYVSLAAWSVTGVFLVETLVRMGIYVRTATKESVPLIE